MKPLEFVRLFVRRGFLLALFALIASAAHARPYGAYDPQRLITVSESPTGKRHALDLAYLDQMLGDLASHARNYPPQFDSAQDQQRAAHDAKHLAAMLDVLVDRPGANPQLLLRAAYVNSLAHNLDVPGAAQKADAIFRKLLAVEPTHASGNHLYGVFLASTGKAREALPYLEKAAAARVVDASYAIGMAYLTLGDKEQALRNLEEYKRLRPEDANADKLIDALRNGKIEIKVAPQ